jgi:NADH:ubiquinone oxidoreductase subunit E
MDEAVRYYRSQGAPGDQNALIQLLKEIQKHNGCVPGHMLKAAAAFYGIKEALLLALIRRVKSLRLGEGDLLEVCAGPNCGKHTELAALAEALCVGKPGITLRFTPCMRQCGKGPNLKWDGTLHNHADAELLKKLLDNK